MGVDSQLKKDETNQRTRWTRPNELVLRMKERRNSLLQKRMAVSERLLRAKQRLHFNLPLRRKSGSNQTDHMSNADLEAMHRNFPVYCLDTGEKISVEEVNAIVEQKKPCIKSRGGFRAKLISFFQKYDLERVDEVDELVNYGGFTNAELWEALQSQYKANQPERLRAIFRQYCPKRLKTVPQLLEDCRGQEEELIFSVREFYKSKSKRDQTALDDCTWESGSSNQYQMLPMRE